jgi:hypothetical protein
MLAYKMLGKTILVLGLFGGFTAPARAQDAGPAAAPAQAATGRLATLPDDREATSGDLLAGHVHLLSKTLDRAIEDLQHGDLREFARSYQQMVDAYTTLTDHLGGAEEAVGAAAMRVGLARESLADAGAVGEPDSQQRQKLAEDVDQIRALLIGRLAAARATLERAEGEQREKLLQQMGGLVARIGQLDKLKRTFEEGARPLVPGLTADDLGRQLDEIDEALAVEQRMLGVVAQAARQSVETLSGHVRRTMLLLEVEAQVPRQQLAQLTAARESVQNTLDEILAAHQRAANGAIRILSRTDDALPIQDAGQLLEQVDRLLGEPGDAAR